MCFIALVKAMPYQSDEAKQQMLYRYRSNYRGCQVELNRIEQFARSYSVRDAINWYTQDSFPYRTINRALRTEQNDALFSSKKEKMMNALSLYTQ